MKKYTYKDLEIAFSLGSILTTLLHWLIVKYFF